MCVGVCYIAPYKNQDLIGSSAFAWSLNFGATVVGTLLLGSAQEKANNNGGSIWFGKNNLLYLHGNFNATNIFLTNNFNVGNPNAGGGATISFNADETLNADGLNYTNFQAWLWAYKPVQVSIHGRILIPSFLWRLKILTLGISHGRL